MGFIDGDVFSFLYNIMVLWYVYIYIKYYIIIIDIQNDEFWWMYTVYIHESKYKVKREKKKTGWQALIERAFDPKKWQILVNSNVQWVNWELWLR